MADTSDTPNISITLPKTHQLLKILYFWDIMHLLHKYLQIAHPRSWEHSST